MHEIVLFVLLMGDDFKHNIDKLIERKSLLLVIFLSLFSESSLEHLEVVHIELRHDVVYGELVVLGLLRDPHQPLHLEVI